VGVGRDPQGAGVDTALPQPVQLADQHPGIDDDAVADHAGLAGVEDPRRDQVQLELLAAPNDRVAGVVAALKANDHVRLLGEQVGDLSLPLVTPLGADNDDSRHGLGIMEVGPVWLAE